jgi:anti-sigma B factor antagonist
LDLNIDRTPAETTVRCTGRITSDTTAFLKTTVKPLLSQSPRVTLDLANVSYMDSSGLGILVGLYASANAAGCRFKLINLTQQLKELLSVTQLMELRWLGS